MRSADLDSPHYKVILRKMLKFWKCVSEGPRRPTVLYTTLLGLSCRVAVIRLNFVVVQMLESERDGQTQHVPVSFG